MHSKTNKKKNRRGRLCAYEWQVGLISSSLWSDTVRRGFTWRSHSAVQWRRLHGVVLTPELSSHYLPPPLHSPIHTTNTSLKFYQPAVMGCCCNLWLFEWNNDLREMVRCTLFHVGVIWIKIWCQKDWEFVKHITHLFWMQSQNGKERWPPSLHVKVYIPVTGAVMCSVTLEELRQVKIFTQGTSLK